MISSVQLKCDKSVQVYNANHDDENNEFPIKVFKMIGKTILA